MSCTKRTFDIGVLEVSRFHAMAQQCRGTPEQTAVLWQELAPFAAAADEMRYAAERRLQQIEEIRKRASTPLCTVWEGWSIPEALCPKCRAAATPEAYFDGDEVSLAMVCKPCGIEYVAELPWPFNEDRAYWSDFQALGIKVES